MNDEKLTEAAMERRKKGAPSRVEPGQGGQGSKTRCMNNTPSARANQEIHISQPAATQRARILARLRIGPATTQELRDELCIMHPAGRVLELRQRNEIITTRLPNRVARYVLVREAGHGNE